MGTVTSTRQEQSIIVIDVKTIPGPYWESNSDFPPLPHHIPVVIGYLLYNLKKEEITLTKHIAGKDQLWESKALTDLRETIKSNNVIRLVTFNGRKFDMPLLGLRAMKHRLNWEWWHNKKRRYPAPGDQVPFHVDLYDQLSDYGAAPSMSLQSLSELLEIGPALTKKSKPTEELWKTGKYKSVEKTCSRDLFRTWLLFLYFSKSSLGIDIKKHLEVSQKFVDDQTARIRREKNKGRKKA